MLNSWQRNKSILYCGFEQGSARRCNGVHDVSNKANLDLLLRLFIYIYFDESLSLKLAQNDFEDF